MMARSHRSGEGAIMLIRWFNAFLFGLVFVLGLDFILFVGLKLNYFDYYGIDIYFNTLFADNQPWLLLLVLSAVLGYAMLYLRGSKIFDRFYIILFLLAALTFYPPVGRAAGERLFTQKGVKASLYGKEVTVDILYKGRDGLWLKKPGAKVATKVAFGDLKVLG